MPESDPQRLAHQFLVEKLRTFDSFTKAEFQQATGWSGPAFNTYWSKQFKAFTEPPRSGRLQVKEGFRPYVDWRKFKELVSQVRRTIGEYREPTRQQIIIYEFFMPMTHENPLRITLDTLFYRDALIPRLKRIDPKVLGKGFHRAAGETDDEYLSKICKFYESKFRGYSIYRVDGRFRADSLSTFDQAMGIQKLGQRYLVDETTAITRFVFPFDEGEAEKIECLFHELFVRNITQVVNGEDEIWLVETGYRNQVHIWKRRTDDDEEDSTLPI